MTITAGGSTPPHPDDVTVRVTSSGDLTGGPRAAYSEQVRKFSAVLLNEVSRIETARNNGTSATPQYTNSDVSDAIVWLERMGRIIPSKPKRLKRWIALRVFQQFFLLFVGATISQVFLPDNTGWFVVLVGTGVAAIFIEIVLQVKEKA